jgi:hypothetical protein
VLLLVVAVGCLRLAARKGWEYLVVAVLAGILARPSLLFVTGDISRWLPGWLWSDGSDGKDQVVVASAVATVLPPVVCGSLLVFLGKLAWRRIAKPQ